MIYLDNAATTKIDPRVLEAMMPYLKEDYGNAGTLYSVGRKAKQAVDKARSQVADFFHCEPDQIIFTSGGTEGNNLVIHGLADHMEASGKKHIVTSSVEHDSVIHAVESLCMKRGFDADFLPVSTRCVASKGSLDMMCRPHRTGLASVMHTNNETGAVNPIYEMASEAHDCGALFHSDCVQAAGIHQLWMDEIPCDFATISSHKIHGPKGVGAVFARDPSILSPIICGGGHQEFGIRGGTENVAGIVGLGMACEIADKEYYRNVEYICGNRALFYDTLWNRLQNTYNADPFISLNGDCSDRISKTLNICVNGVDGETLLLMLDSKGICVSAGSACRSLEEHPSRVLTAMGLSEKEARSSVRVSFSSMESPSDIIYAAETMASCIITLRNAT